jgi:hypothetical protein
VDQDPVSVTLSVPRDLPPVVNKRITTNVVRSVLTQVTGGSARLVARRVPGQDGVRCWARLEDGAVDSPMVRRELVELLERLRAELATS